VTGPKEPAGLPAGVAGLGRSAVMAVLNVTPDSFSDGGRYTDLPSAVAHGLAEHAAGGDLVDVGGESTRPGAERVPAEEEQRRVLPVVRALVSAGVPVSIDTMRASTAAAAVEAGACLVNDVSGGLADETMLATVAALRVPYVAMHWRGPSDRMTELAVYDDVVRDVRRELRGRLEAAVSAGLDPAFVVLDPGLGFAKNAAHNWALLGHLQELADLGRPLLIGASRKRFLGELLADSATGDPRALPDRDAATDAVSALAARAGVWCVRVHAVRGTLDAVRVAAAWRDGKGR
jgi:dihydropteroate synthase